GAGVPGEHVHAVARDVTDSCEIHPVVWLRGPGPLSAHRRATGDHGWPTHAGAPVGAAGERDGLDTAAGPDRDRAGAPWPGQAVSHGGPKPLRGRIGDTDNHERRAAALVRPPRGR